MTFGAVVFAIPVVFAAWLFLMIDREPDPIAVPALILSAGGAGWLCRTAAQGGELLLFLPFAAVVAWAGLAAALLRLRADYVEWAGR